MEPGEHSSFPSPYGEAWAAVEKRNQGVSPKDRQAVRQLIEEINTTGDSRMQHFRTQIGGSGAFFQIAKRDFEEGRESQFLPKTNEGRQQVLDQWKQAADTENLLLENLQKIPETLQNFAAGQNIPDNLLEPVCLYVKRWAEMAKSEQGLFDIVNMRLPMSRLQD